MSESEDEFDSESVFDEEDNEMSDYDGSDEPDDLITLDQYQTGIWKENLVCWVPQEVYASQKNGRPDKGIEDS